MRQPIALRCPARLLLGMCDDALPWKTSLGARRAAREPQCCGNSAEVRRSPAVERIRSCPPGQNLRRARWRAALMRSLCLYEVLTLLACFGRGEASAQDTAAEEAARRAMVIAQLPPDAAKVLFGRESTPAA